MTVSFQETEWDATEEDLRKVESVIGTSLPEDYRRHLTRFNGGRPTPAGFNVTWSGQEWAEGWSSDEVHDFLAAYDGDVANLLDFYEMYSGRIPPDAMPIGYDQGGNLLLLGLDGTRRGKVYLWLQDYRSEGDPDYSNVGFVAHSFDRFLDLLHHV